MAFLNAPTSFTISPTVPSCLSLPLSEFLASRPNLEYLMAGVLVFRIDLCSSTPQLQTQLIRRASSDSYALKWEKPAGGIASLDSTVLSCAVRELWEETGLHASHIRCPVGISASSEKELQGWGVEPEAEQVESQSGDEALTVTVWNAGSRWGVVTVIVDVEENLSDDGIGGKTVGKLAPEEHEEWMWVTEEQVRSGRGKDGKTMEYTSVGVWRIVLEGFRVKKGVDFALLM